MFPRNFGFPAFQNDFFPMMQSAYANRVHCNRRQVTMQPRLMRLRVDFWRLVDREKILLTKLCQLSSGGRPLIDPERLYRIGQRKHA
jgi:hypothetical protein